VKNCWSTRTVRRVTGGCGDPRWRRCGHQPSVGLARPERPGRRRGESRIRLESSRRVRRGSAPRVQRLTKSDRRASPNCTRSAVGKVRHRRATMVLATTAASLGDAVAPVCVPALGYSRLRPLRVATRPALSRPQALGTTLSTRRPIPAGGVGRRSRLRPVGRCCGR
jgi:hypothetical protein